MLDDDVEVLERSDDRSRGGLGVSALVFVGGNFLELFKSFFEGLACRALMTRGDAKLLDI